MRYFLLTILFLSLACSKSPTSPDTFSLAGTVHLEGQEDHSGVTVAVYAPVALDTMVQRMNREFHTVGIPISQATEFDHRQAEPVYQTQTKADGSYNLNGLAEGSYNMVAVKTGYGWKYLYEIEIAKGTKTSNAENIVLYPEMEISGELNQYTVWPSEHHIIVKGDVKVPEGETLIIDKGAVIRFDGFYELEIEGSLQVNGELENMTVFTSNLSQTNPGDWKAIKMKGASGEVQLQGAKVEFANTGVDGVGGRIDVIKSRFRQISYAGVLAANECQANVIESSFSHCVIGVRAEGNSKALIQHNLVYEYQENSTGIGINVNNSDADLADNILAEVDIGVKTEYITGTRIVRNYVTDCGVGISTINTGPIIEKNTLSNCSQAVIYISGEPVPAIAMNNILASDNQNAVWASGRAYNDINASNNFWGTQDIEVAKRTIFDQRVDANGNKTTFKINIDPIALQLYDAKPR